VIGGWGKLQAPLWPLGHFEKMAARGWLEALRVPSYLLQAYRLLEWKCQGHDIFKFASVKQSIRSKDTDFKGELQWFRLRIADSVKLGSSHQERRPSDLLMILLCIQIGVQWILP
jgi:hypothetical protein